MTQPVSPTHTRVVQLDRASSHPCPSAVRSRPPTLEDSFILLDALEQDVPELRAGPSGRICVEIGSVVSRLDLLVGETRTTGEAHPAGSVSIRPSSLPGPALGSYQASSEVYWGAVELVRTKSPRDRPVRTPPALAHPCPALVLSQSTSPQTSTRMRPSVPFLPALITLFVSLTPFLSLLRPRTHPLSPSSLPPSPGPHQPDPHLPHHLPSSPTPSKDRHPPIQPTLRTYLAGRVSPSLACANRSRDPLRD